MNTFAAHWLKRREAFDHAARSKALVTALLGALPKAKPLRVAAFGAGLGSGMRFLAPHLGPDQRWTLIDNDLSLLRQALTFETPHGVALKTLEMDLRESDYRALDVDLVTTQALLDLVSADWLVDFADWICDKNLPVLAALTVDGRVNWHPPHPLDQTVQRCFRAHQLTDRGFGASPGPMAAQAFALALSKRGYTVTMARADWKIGRQSSPMLTEMLTGTALAATEACAGITTAQSIAEWSQDRAAGIAKSEVSLCVGHLDVLGLPPS